MTLCIPPERWTRKTGRLVGVGGRMRARLDAAMGELVEIQNSRDSAILAEVIGFEGPLVQLMPFDSANDLRHGAAVISKGRRMDIPVGSQMLGRVIGSLCQPIDGMGPLRFESRVDLVTKSPAPLKRPHIQQQFVTGIRAIDSLLTIGQGQRVGLFAGSGVGKSTLLGEITKHAESDINVVALVGERGREVRPFVESSLGPEGLERSVVVVSTSDQPPLARIRACETAVTIADWYRAQGNNVLLIVDSLTRLAHAQRELGLFLGEPPTSRGYTPSVFQVMAKLLEQLGTSEKGSITGLITVLVDADDMNDPIADTARSILDGHIALDRGLAQQGHYPAIDVLASASRLFTVLAGDTHQRSASIVRSAIAQYREVEDLIQIGAYKSGANPGTDRAINTMPKIVEFLKQPLARQITMPETLNDLNSLAQIIENGK